MRQHAGQGEAELARGAAGVSVRRGSDAHADPL